MRPAVLRQIQIASASSATTYTVTETAEGWQCSCPAWTRRVPRRDCKHIDEARALPPSAATGLTADAWRRIATFANVGEVTIGRDAAGRPTAVKVPLQPLGESHTGFVATIAYDLIMAGMPWAVVQEYAVIARANPRDAILEYVRARGRVVERDFVPGKGYTRREVCPVTAPAYAAAS